jgi:hypothetical protein
MLAYSGRRCGVNLSWRCTAATGQRRLVGVKGGRACSAGIRSERVEAVGGGRAYDLDACGRLGRRDERARQALQSIPRALVSAPAVHHSVSRWRRPAAGWGSRPELLCG